MCLKKTAREVYGDPAPKPPRFSHPHSSSVTESQGGEALPSCGVHQGCTAVEADTDAQCDPDKSILCRCCPNFPIC